LSIIRWVGRIDFGAGGFVITIWRRFFGRS
jgi:hypothetical protein